MVAIKVPRSCYPDVVSRYKAGESVVAIGRDFDAGYQCIYQILRKMKAITLRPAAMDKETARTKPQPTYKAPPVRYIDPNLKQLAMSKNGQRRAPLRLPPLRLTGSNAI